MCCLYRDKKWQVRLGLNTTQQRMVMVSMPSLASLSWGYFYLLLTKGPHIQRELNLEQELMNVFSWSRTAAVLLLCCRFTVPAVSVKTFTFLLTSTTGRRRRENFLSDSEDVCIEMLKKTFLIQMLFMEDAASAEPSPHRLCQCYQWSTE